MKLQVSLFLLKCKDVEMAKNQIRKDEMKIYRQQLNELVKDSKRSQLAFPPILDSSQRKNLHTIAHKLGLKSKSHGKGDDRFLIVYKKTVQPYTTQCYERTAFKLSENSIEKIQKLIESDPVGDLESQNNTLRHSNLTFIFGNSHSKSKVTVPPTSNISEEFRLTRQNLPIFDHRDGILSIIEKHQVVVISGDTGSGKTTQVPQYILEQCAYTNKPCRIICTQPRRLAATSIATRISEERNDSLGKSVGYQIRLDSRITSTTNLILTTSGYLLRCLTGCEQEEVYKNITHLIIDEVHEREKVTDFLLIAIRDAVQVNKHLKVILMSATLDSELFSSYFGNCPVINVPGRTFDVEIKHLDHILMETSYKSKKMEIYMAENHPPKILSSKFLTEKQSDKIESSVSQEDIDFFDECFEECLDKDDDTTFEQIFCLITDENMPVDHMHSKIKRTGLAIAAEKGFKDVLIKLLSHGAKANFVDPHGKKASDYAEKNNHPDCFEILRRHELITPCGADNVSGEDINNEARAQALKQYTLAAYQLTAWNDIDHELLFHVILHIHTTNPTDGSVLVFLPGYDDIMKQKDMIEQYFHSNNYQLFVLHSGVNGTNSADQSRVFDRMPNGVRKIILSTNIAETSLTINDVVYVVDVGKVKQLSYDSINESTCLTSTGISQACAKQRAGRAGRTRNGFCYRLYSKEQYDSMENYTLPEILRVPLTEICLNSKMLAGDLSIEAFLLKALQPPAAMNIRKSIELLKKISALDENENITYLGIHLANMPVDCQYGKMILYAIVMRCLDPIVTIVSVLSVKDPFMLPTGDETEKINRIKQNFAQNSMSDHQMLLNTYNEWKRQKKKSEFCQENFMSCSNMFMTQGVRNLIMGHLKMADLVSENSAHNMKNLNLNSDKWVIVKACLTAGMYPNVCRITSLTGQIYSKHDKKLLPHLSSVLRNKKSRNQINHEVLQLGSEWLIHGDKSRVSNFSLIRNISIISAIEVILFTGPIILPVTKLDYCDSEALSDMDCDDIPETEFDDFDDEELFTKVEREHDAVLQIDDWISFILEREELYLVYGLRQKFGCMLSRFLKDPVSFQMTFKDELIMKTLLEVIEEEDEVEKCLKIKKSVEQQANVEGPLVPAFATDSYKQSIHPNEKKNRFQRNKSRLQESPNIPLLTNKTSQNTNSRIQELSQPSTSYASSNWRIAQNDVEAPDIGSLKLDSDLGIKTNRYFLLTVKNMNHLYKSVYEHVWSFKTPLKKMRAVARETSSKIILLMHLQKVSAICGCGEFEANSSGEYDIKLDRHIFRLQPLYRMNAFKDYELDSKDGYAIHNMCLRLATNAN